MIVRLLVILSRRKNQIIVGNTLSTLSTWLNPLKNNGDRIFQQLYSLSTTSPPVSNLTTHAL